MNVIYNSVPTSLHKEVANRDDAAIRLDLTSENAAECADVLGFYGRVLTNGADNTPPFLQWSAGSFHR